MVMIRGKDFQSDKWICTLEIANPSELPSNLKLPSRHFCLLVLMDAHRFTDEILLQFADNILRQGAVYICNWGPERERVHDLFDEVRDELIPESTDSNIILTSWHEDETLEEVICFVINTAWPAPDYTDTCETVLVLAAGNTEWSAPLSEQAEKFIRVNQDIRHKQK